MEQSLKEQKLRRLIRENIIKILKEDNDVHLHPAYREKVDEDNEVSYHSSYDNISSGQTIRYDGTCYLQNGDNFDFSISTTGKRLSEDEIQSQVEDEYGNEIKKGNGISYISAQED